VSSLLRPRELQVLQRMAKGMTNRRIGEDLRISEDTVKTHAHRLYQRLCANDRAHAVALGYQHGLLTVKEAL